MSNKSYMHNNIFSILRWEKIAELVSRKMKNSWLHFIVIWGSFAAFLALYILQKGCGLEDMELPFFIGKPDRAQVYYTSPWVNIISFIFIAVVFGFVYATKVNKSFSALRGGILKWFTVLCLLSVIVLKAHYSYPLDGWNVLEHSWCVYIVLAIISIPSILFFLSWISEKSGGLWEDRVGCFLQGRTFLVVCVLVALNGLVLDLYFAFSPDVWHDEGATLDMISGDWTDMMAIAIQDVHPPFYLIVYKLSISLFHYYVPAVSAITAAKMAAVMPHLILLVICLTMVRKKWGNFVAGMGAVAVVCGPYMLYTSQELRLYGWALLWVTGSWLFLHGILTLNRLRDWSGFVACSIMTIYTCYPAGIAVGLLWLMLAVWTWRHHCMKKWWVALGISFAAYFPWLLVMVMQIFYVESSGFWMPPMTAQKCFELMLTPARDVLVIVFVMVFVGLYAARRPRKQFSAYVHVLVGMSLVFIVLLLMCGLSCMGTPIITTRARYVVPMLACLWLGFLVSTEKTPKLRMLAALMILFIAISELQSFVRVQRAGAQGAMALQEFTAKDETSVEYVIPLQSNAYSARWACYTLYWMLGKDPYILISVKQAIEEHKPDPDIPETRVNNILKRYNLPRFVSPCVTMYVYMSSYMDAFMEACKKRKPFILKGNEIMAEEVKDLLDSGKVVYCLCINNYDNKPDLNATEELLSPCGLLIRREPSLHVNINSGACAIYLYKLESSNSILSN